VNAEIKCVIKKIELSVKQGKLSENEEQLRFLKDELMMAVVSNSLKKIDQSLKGKMKAENHTLKDKRKRSMTTTFGVINYSRYYYIKDGKRCFPLDDHLGFKPRERFTKAFRNQTVSIIGDTTYRRESDIVSKLTGSDINPTTIRENVLEFSKEARDYQEYLDIATAPKPKQVKRLYIEGDGVSVKGRAQYRKKGWKIELHRYQLHEGVRKISKNRYELINPVFFFDTDRLAAYQRLSEYVYRNYKLKDTIIITNSDGGAGYTYDDFKDIAQSAKHHEHFIDRYHVRLKIETRMRFFSDLIPLMRKAWYSYDCEAVRVVLDTAESMAVEDEEISEIEALRAYIDRNWAYMKPAYMREHVKNGHGIGTCESNHRAYTYRMKHRGMSWRKDGAMAVALVIESKRNQTFDIIVGGKWRAELESKRRELKRYKMRNTVNHAHQAHVGVYQGVIKTGAVSSPIGKLNKHLNG
jgi:hypothetical protein